MIPQHRESAAEGQIIAGQPAVAVRRDPAALFHSIAGNERAWLALILIGTALVYSRSLGNEFIRDDSWEIVGNRYLADWSFIWKSLVSDDWWFDDPLDLPQSGFYRPLHDIWLWLNFHLFGLNPVGWHAAMIALHLAVVWMVYRVTSLLTDPSVGLLAAALFALVPVHADAIVWPSTIAQPLSAFFQLGAFEFYLRSRADGGAGEPWRRRLALSLALFGGALLCHESAAVFPALIAAHAFLFPRFSIEGTAVPLLDRARGALAAIWPYALEVAAYLGMRLWIFGGFFGLQIQAGIRAAVWPLLRTVALAFPQVFAAYLTALIAPWQAGPVHPALDYLWSIGSMGFYLSAAGLAALFGTGAMLLRRNPHRRLYLFCTAWILIALGPVFAGSFPGVDNQDRYLYLPSFGFFVIAASLAVDFARGGEWRVKAAWIGTAAVLLGSAVLLFSVQRFWHDPAALQSIAVEENPHLS